MFSIAKSESSSSRFVQIKRVLWITLVLNLAVSLIKIVVGLATNCIVVFADGIHSLSDASSNVVALVGIAIAAKPADHNHPYGHEKFETLTASLIGVFLCIAAYNIIREASEAFIHPKAPTINVITFGAMALTLMVNIFVAWYERREGKRLKSDLLISDAWHTSSDIFVSLGVVVALIGMKAGLPYLDSLFSMGIAVFIIWVAVGIVRESAHVLCDAAVLDTKLITQAALAVSDVRDCHEVRTRGRKDAVYVDMHILVDAKMSVERSHQVSHDVERTLQQKFENIREVVVHVEPDDHDHDFHGESLRRES